MCLLFTTVSEEEICLMSFSRDKILTDRVNLRQSFYEMKSPNNRDRQCAVIIKTVWSHKPKSTVFYQTLLLLLLFVLH